MLSYNVIVMSYHFDYTSEKVILVRRTMNGLLNRLSEQTKDPTIRSIKSLYDSYSSTIVTDVLKDNIEPAMDILADTVLNPLFLPEEIDESKQIVELQMMQMAQKSPEILSRDCVQRAAYENFPLGNHHFCPLDLVNEIDTKRIVDFREKYLYGQNCYLSGSGVDHGLLVKLAEKHFGGMQMKEGIGNDRKSV